MNGSLMNRISISQFQILTHFAGVLIACALLFVAAAPAHAQAWARDMFDVTIHDFGVVPRGAKTEFEFKFKNKYKEIVHVSSVRTSCRCTIPRISQDEVKTYQESSIIAEFKTSDFVGARSAVITVVFDKPFQAELQLLVKGTIRSDIVPMPGEIQFGEVDLGTEKLTDVKIAYLGTAKWEINDVLSNSEHLAVKLGPPQVVAGGKIEYHMDIRLKDDAPAGEFADEIVLVTNEAQSNRVTLPVRANVVPPLFAQGLQLGTVKVGEKRTDRLLVKAKVPFRIENIVCSDQRFDFKLPTDLKAAHLIPFEFTADDKEGAFLQTIVVHTNLKETPTAEATVTGNITQ